MPETLGVLLRPRRVAGGGCGRTIYHWRVRFANGTRAGLHLFASEGASAQRGNSYLVWQNDTVVKIYEAVANTLYWRAEFPAPNATGQTHAYQVMYEPDSGQLRVWRDDVYLDERQTGTRC